MEKLIKRKFYATAQDARDRLDVFFELGRLDADEYKELDALVETVYGEAAEWA